MKKPKMRIMDHIAELRRRVLFCALFFLIAFGAGWYFSPIAQDLIVAPLQSVWADGALLWTGLADALMIRLDIALMLSAVLSLPFAMFQLFRFARPGLKGAEGKFIASVMLASPVFFVAGAAFVYFFLMPVMFEFFIGFSEEGNFASVLLPNMAGYVALCVGLMKTFGLAFQLPVILVVLNRIGFLGRESAVKARRFVWVGMFIVGAMLTPPDLVSCIALALPLIMLFEGSLLVMKRR
ncbi:MAG: twin-arginine translocase subunit TatC [Rickettsiales bacterium]|jgi:sec-independent protein translocase protein TatC|nr:twin-arginine translocase subunit TatC [Rickettsiales bacterium]